jgi:mannose-6-phosphate isomerase-like protein (cupin superfamily)
MSLNDLERLNTAANILVNQKAFSETVERLSGEVGHSREPFAWSVVDPESLGGGLPEGIKSCWVFVLKAGVPSGCHYHPNSVQHMVVVSGQGVSKVGDETRRMASLGSPGYSLPEVWYVIGEGVPHEFFPGGENMVVISFHTCEAHELEEVACGTGDSRLYEGRA